MKKSFFTLIFFLSFLMFAHDDYEIFNLGNFKLESGVILPNAKLSYVTHGKLNKRKDNLILVPSSTPLGIVTDIFLDACFLP